MASPQFDAFIESLEQMSHVWRDDFDLGALLSLVGEERAAAEERLVGQVLVGKDPRAVRALALLEPTNMVDLLRQALPVSIADARVEVARLLYDLAADQSAVDVLIEAFGSDSYTVRQRAAFTLGHMKEARTRRPLIAALDDTDARVRRTAADALLTQVDVNAPVKTKLYLLVGEVSSASLAVRSEARPQFESLLDKLDGGGGIDPTWTEPVELTPAYTEFAKSLRCRPGQQPWPDRLAVEAFNEMPSFDKRKLRLATLRALERDDPRAPAALMAVLEDAPAVLATRRASAVPQMADAIDAVLGNSTS